MKNIKYKNKDLHDALLDYTKKAIQVLSGKEKEINVHLNKVNSWIKNEDGNFIFGMIEKVFWGCNLLKLGASLHYLKEYEKCSSIMMEDATINYQIDKNVSTWIGGGSHITLDSINNYIIFDMIEKKYTFDFDLDFFESKYLKLEEWLYSKEIEFERLTPLTNFESEITEIKLNNNISIKQLSDNEIQLILNMGIKMGFGFPGVMMYVPKFVIKIQYKLPKVFNQEMYFFEEVKRRNPYVSDDIEKSVMKYLRIFKKGSIYASGTISFNPVDCPSIFFKSPISISHGFLPHSTMFISNKYHLNADEAQDFKELWSLGTSNQVTEKGFLNIAIDRFSQASERTNPEDKIIDLLICAEALFLGGVKDELKYRLAERAAFFIEKDALSRKKLFKYMKQVYDVRSAIVHGNKPKLPKKIDGTIYSLEEFGDEAEEYLRIALKKFIKLAQNPKAPKSIVDWDSLIFER